MDSFQYGNDKNSHILRLRKGFYLKDKFCNVKNTVDAGSILLKNWFHPVLRKHFHPRDISDYKHMHIFLPLKTMLETWKNA